MHNVESQGLLCKESSHICEGERTMIIILNNLVVELLYYYDTLYIIRT